jgi:hypothetical protein
MTKYFRVGNRTFTEHELQFMTPKKIEEVKADGELANQKRLENIRKGLGMEPQKVTLDVTPAGVATRNAAIAVEEARIAAETKAIEEDLGPISPNAIAEAEAPAEVETKKSKGKKVA